MCTWALKDYRKQATIETPEEVQHLTFQTFVQVSDCFLKVEEYIMD